MAKETTSKTTELPSTGGSYVVQSGKPVRKSHTNPAPSRAEKRAAEKKAEKKEA